MLVLGPATSPRSLANARDDIGSCGAVRLCPLLVSKGIDRIEPRRLPGRVEAEEDADDGGHTEGDGDRDRRNHDRPIEELADAERGSDAGAYTEDAPDDGQGH